MIIRDLISADYATVLELNNKNLPAVSELSLASLKALHEQSVATWVMEDDSLKKMVGFCIILHPKAHYESDNYKWVTKHYSEFEYLDRVVIAKPFRGKGVGRKIYSHWFKRSKLSPLLLEVNIKPMNKGSILFHEKMGFEAVGEQDTSGGTKRVQYMALKN